MIKEHAAIVIKNETGEILFIKRSIKKKTLPGCWSFPSGTREVNEDIFNTAIRESKEELDVLVSPIKLIASQDLTEFNVRLYFILCKITEGIPTIKDFDELEKIEWLKISDFFDKYTDSEIGHGLIWLRQNKNILKEI